MTISYLFSRNQKIGSKAISWASGLLVKDLEKIPSHVAIKVSFSEEGVCYVIESVLGSGVRIIPYEVWLQINEQCYEIPAKSDVSFLKLQNILLNIWGKKYDYLGITYFAVAFIKHLVLAIPFPLQNKWQQDDAYFCSEAVFELSGYEKAGMVTPAKMCSDFLKEVNNG